MVNVETIEANVNNLKQLQEIARRMENQIKEDLIQLDRDAFDGLTWGEFLNSIKEDVQVNDKILIRRESYRINGIYQLDDNVKMEVSGNIYHGDERFRPSISYQESGRYVSEVPKKYQKQYDELIAEMRKYQFERPSDKYSKDLGLAYF